VLGGTQSLHTNARDEALALPTPETARLALRTQQILAHESGVTETPDPLAGSYYVESLTDRLEAAAQAYLDEIDDMGGAIAAIDAGYQQRQIQDAAYRVQREIETQDRIVVGVNRFSDDEVVTPPLQRIDPALEREQVERLRALRAERDRETWAAALRHLGAVARSADNVVPAVIEAVKAQATLGEISDELRAVWGEHRELVTV
jgi:methylmalonyl-CoA mutase, N-terminal domain